MIFEAPLFTVFAESWRTGHEIVAESAVKNHYKAEANFYLNELLACLDGNNAEQRRFASHLLSQLSSQYETRPVAERIIQAHPSATKTLSRIAPTEAPFWARVFDRLGMTQEAEVLIEITRPDSAESQIMWMTVACRHKPVSAVLERTAAWLRHHPDDTHVRVVYLELMESKGNQRQIEAALNEAAIWMRDHPDDAIVRPAYLALVGRQGSQAQIMAVLDETTAWLRDEPEALCVRAAYLGVVAKSHDEAQIQTALDNTVAWLREHPVDKDVHGAYLGLVRRKGNQP